MQTKVHYFDNSLKQYETNEEATLFYYLAYDIDFNIIWSDSLPLSYEVNNFYYIENFKNINSYNGDIRPEDTITERIPAPKQEEFQRYNNPKGYRYFIKYYINDFMESLEDYKRVIEEAKARKEIIYPKRYIYDYKAGGKANKVKTQAEQLDPHKLKEFFPDLELLHLNHLNETENYEYIILPYFEKILEPEGVDVIREIYFHNFTMESRADKEAPEAVFFRNLPANLPALINSPEIKNYTDLIKYNIRFLGDHLADYEKRINDLLTNINFLCIKNNKDFEQFKAEAWEYFKSLRQELEPYEIKEKLAKFRHDNGTLNQALYLFCAECLPLISHKNANTPAFENHKRILQNITTDEIAHNPAFVFPGTDEHRKEIDLTLKGYYDNLIPYIKRNPLAVELATERDKNNHIEDSSYYISQFNNIWFYFRDPTEEELAKHMDHIEDKNRLNRELEEIRALKEEYKAKIKAYENKRKEYDLTLIEKKEAADAEEQLTRIAKNEGDTIRALNRAYNDRIIAFYKDNTSIELDNNIIYKKIECSPKIINVQDQGNEIIFILDYMIVSFPKAVKPTEKRENNAFKTEYINIFEYIKEKNEQVLNNFFSFVLSRNLGYGPSLKPNISILPQDILRILAVQDSGHMANYNSIFYKFWAKLFNEIKIRNITKFENNRLEDKPQDCNFVYITEGNEYTFGEVVPKDFFRESIALNHYSYVTDERDNLSPQASAIFNYMIAEININEAKLILNTELSLFDIKIKSKVLYNISKCFNGKKNAKAGNKWKEILTDIGNNKGILFKEFRYYNSDRRTYQTLTIQEGYNLLTSYTLREINKEDIERRQAEAKKQGKSIKPEHERHDLKYISLVIAKDPKQHPSQLKLIEKVNQLNKKNSKAEKKFLDLQDKQLKEGR